LNVEDHLRKAEASLDLARCLVKERDPNLYDEVVTAYLETIEHYEAANRQRLTANTTLELAYTHFELTIIYWNMDELEEANLHAQQSLDTVKEVYDLAPSIDSRARALNLQAVLCYEFFYDPEKALAAASEGLRYTAVNSDEHTEFLAIIWELQTAERLNIYL
jgi:tetratricopeptide (TPR) repeat protein